MKHLIFLMVSLCVVVAKAQVITIKDIETLQPLEMVTLSSAAPLSFATTNARGQLEISAFSGAEKIEIRFIGYKTEILSYQQLVQRMPTVYLQPTNISLDQVVVSATRWRQPIRNIPGKLTTITAREVALQNPQTAADLLGASGEVFIQKSQQGGGSPMIRGFSTNRLLIAVDGVRMNTAIFRSGNLQNVISLDPFAVENTEVLFGPGSVIYGSDAIGGVMSFQTLDAELSLNEKMLVHGNALVRHSSANNERATHFDVQVGWQKWALVTSISHIDFGDLRMGRNGPDDYLRPFYVQRQDTQDVVIANTDPLVQRQTGYGQTNLMQKIRFRPNDKWDFTYAFHYSATTDNPRYDRLIRTRNGIPRSAEWSYGPQVWQMNHFTATHSQPNAVYDQLSIRLAHQWFEESRYDRDFGDITRFERMENVDALSANLDFTKAWQNRHRLYYGLEGVYNGITSSGLDRNILTGEAVAGPSRYPESDWQSYALYATYQFDVSEKVLLQGGARYNQYALNASFDTTFYAFPFTEANISNGALTGSMGLVVRPSDMWMMSANVSTGFRAPNIDDIGKVFDSEPGSVVIPNPNLQAEYAYNAEVSIARVFGKAVMIDLTGFYTLLDNAMVRRDFTLNGADSIMYDGELSQVQAIQNAAVATVYGLQAGLEIKLPEGFSLSGRINWQNGTEELDNGEVSASRHVAPLFGLVRLQYATRQLRMECNLQYNGEISYNNLNVGEQGKPYLYASDANGNPYAPAWYTLNFKAIYQLNEQLAIGTGLENITDQRYRPYSSGIAAAGRNMVLSLRANF